MAEKHRYIALAIGMTIAAMSSAGASYIGTKVRMAEQDLKINSLEVVLSDHIKYDRLLQESLQEIKINLAKLNTTIDIKLKGK